MIVFVHGVPETAAIWRKVRAAISASSGRESTALALPGFGNPRPEGFTATKDAYVDWLLGELAAFDEPVDIVGHDWGAGFVYRVATAHGDTVRSWAADVGNIAHPDYVWHAIAEIWQTPGAGEQFVESQNATPAADRATGLMGMGLSYEDALEMAAGQDETMGRCILDLYRSATPNPHHHWGPWSPTSAPGLVIHTTGDPFSDAAKAKDVADALGARYAELEGPNHFWPYEAPEAGAALLESFWDGIG